MTIPDLDLLARTAYDTGIDPVTYATSPHHRSPHRGLPRHAGDLVHGQRAAIKALSCIAGDLLGAGWTPPEVTHDRLQRRRDRRPGSATPPA